MLYTLLVHHPEALGAIVRSTPTWVWGLLAGLLLLGASQLRARTASLGRVAITPIAMTLFSALGVWSAFGRSALGVEVIAAWLLVVVAVTGLLALGRGAGHYDAARREFHLPGSVVPLLLIAGIFLVKWAVGVEMVLQPGRAADAAFAFSIAVVYGVFSGLFAGRAARLWKLAVRA